MAIEPESDLVIPEKVLTGYIIVQRPGVLLFPRLDFYFILFESRD
jgi:hypothetical protein